MAGDAPLMPCPAGASAPRGRGRTDVPLADEQHHALAAAGLAAVELDGHHGEESFVHLPAGARREAPPRLAGQAVGIIDAKCLRRLLGQRPLRHCGAEEE